MDNKIRNFKQSRQKRLLKKNTGNIIALILILCMGIFYISSKEGYHMDELLSFELSNAEFTPWIVTTQPEGRLEKFVKNEIYEDSFGGTCSNIAAVVKDVLKNKKESKLLSYKADVYEQPVWITAGQFKDYITTSGRDRFNYLSVYFNVKDDNHPPLHFMALHTVSSLFPEKAAPWMGCCINLMLVLGICCFLMKLCLEVSEKEELGWAVCILYGCSVAGIATILLIRMYAMLTFFCMAALYLHIRKMQSGEWNIHNGRLILVTVCGFLTQYYFVIFMLFLAGTTVFFLLREYSRKELFYYIRTMGISAVIGLCVFPFSIADVLYSGRGVESVSNLKSGFGGLGERFQIFLAVIKKEAFGGTIGIGIFLLIVLSAFAAWLFAKNAESAEMAEINRKKREKDRKINDSRSHIYWMAGVPLLGYFLVVVKIAPYYVDRYLMPVFPLLAFFMGVILYHGLEFLKGMLPLFGKKWVLLAAVMLIVLPGIKPEKQEYLYLGYKPQKMLSEQFSDTACLCIYDGVGYYENLAEFVNYKETLMVTRDELLERLPDPVFEQNKRLVVLYKNNTDPDGRVSAYLAEKYGFQMSHYLMRETVHKDTLVLYEKQEGI